jgi:hypothetical protein
MRPKSTTYFELRDDALSVNCEHPRKGDIIAAIDEEGKDGELHTVPVNGTHHVGYLYRKGNSLILKFPNPNFPDITIPGREAKVMKVTRFYYRQEGAQGKLPRKKSARKPSSKDIREQSEERISELRSHLQALKDEGEAHNESGVFKLERAIYDLERSAPDDEWPDWMPG